MSGFWIFAADALHDFFSRTNQNKCSIITRFLPAADNLVDVNYDTVQHNRHMYVHDVCFLVIWSDWFELFEYLADKAMLCKGEICCIET